MDEKIEQSIQELREKIAEYLNKKKGQVILTLEINFSEGGKFGKSYINKNLNDKTVIEK